MDWDVLVWKSGLVEGGWLHCLGLYYPSEKLDPLPYFGPPSNLVLYILQIL